jgi:hypothetical protein
MEFLDIHQTGRTHVDRVPCPSLHFLFSVSEDLHTCAVDNRTTRRASDQEVSGRGACEGCNEHTHTDAKSNMTALIGLKCSSLSSSLVLFRLSVSFHNLIFSSPSITCGLLFAFSLKYSIIVIFTDEAFG